MHRVDKAFNNTSPNNKKQNDTKKAVDKVDEIVDYELRNKLLNSALDMQN